MDVHKALAIAPERMTVIGGAAQALPPPSVGDAERSAPLFLYVGSALPHKNLKTLVAAFARDDAPPGRLVIAGPIYAEAERAAIERLQDRGDRVEYRGFVSTAELADLYCQATCVVLPTLHEGFGLTVLEAFQAKVPMVASRLPVIEEVAGDAAYLVDRPLEPGAWAAALRRVAEDDVLRVSLVERGVSRLQRYSWAVVGERWAQLLARPVANPARRARSIENLTHGV
jgi:glycosyltransferase involved in cell wall biosynthesis